MTRYDLEMKTREQNRNNKRTEIELCDCMVYRTDTNARGLWLVKRTLREKKLHAQELSTDQSILRFDVILQRDLPIEKCLLHIRVFFGGFDLFVHWLIKQITNTCRVIPKPFSKVMRKSL